jgi:hypothetical protein
VLSSLHDIVAAYNNVDELVRVAFTISNVLHVCFGKCYATDRPSLQALEIIGRVCGYIALAAARYAVMSTFESTWVFRAAQASYGHPPYRVTAEGPSLFTCDKGACSGSCRMIRGRLSSWSLKLCPGRPPHPL